MRKNKSKIYLVILLVIFIVFVGGLALYFARTRQEEKQGETQEAITPIQKKEGIEIANPATKYCKDQGYKSEIKTNPDKGQYRVCIFSDGEQCEEWAYYRGECQPAAKEEREEKSTPNESTEVEKGNIYTSSLKNIQSFSVQYPEGWRANEIEEKSEVVFLPQGAKPAAEYTGDITVTYKKNEQNLSIERFYDGLNDVNLFEDASGGFEKLKVSGYTVYKFKGVVGYVPTTMAVFVLDRAFVEVTDVYNKHQKDGVFDKFVETFKVEK